MLPLENKIVLYNKKYNTKNDVFNILLHFDLYTQMEATSKIFHMIYILTSSS